MAKCPYCSKKFAADTIEQQNDASGRFTVFICPECDVVLGIVRS